MVMKVGHLNRMHGGKHQDTQAKENAVLKAAWQTERVMLRIVRLSQAGQENVK